MSETTPQDALALQLVEHLGLPKNVVKLTLTFEARAPIVAEVSFIPDSGDGLTLATSRFKCTPIDDAESVQGA